MFPNDIQLIDAFYFVPELAHDGVLCENILVIKSRPFPEGVHIVRGHKYKSEGPPLHIAYYDIGGVIYDQEELVQIGLAKDSIDHHYIIYGSIAVEKYGDPKYSSGVKVIVLKKK